MSQLMQTVNEHSDDEQLRRVSIITKLVKDVGFKTGYGHRNLTTSPVKPFNYSAGRDKSGERNNDDSVDFTIEGNEMEFEIKRDKMPKTSGHQNLQRYNSAMSVGNTSAVSMVPTYQQGEREFFKLLLLSNLLNQSPFFLNRLGDLNARTMYKEATMVYSLRFDQFQEFIEHRIQQHLFSWDDYFDAIEYESADVSKAEEPAYKRVPSQIAFGLPSQAEISLIEACNSVRLSNFGRHAHAGASFANVNESGAASAAAYSQP